MAVAREIHDRVRKPEYTGKNRCIPCTVVNLAIAIVLTLGLSWFWIPLGAAFFLVAVVSIGLRGYLVPGTPTLTRRYFPEWLLAKFDKAPEELVDEVDPEAVLLESGVIEPCADEADVCLSEGFREPWQERIEALREEEAEREAMAEQLGLDPEELTFESHGRAYVARHDGRRVGQWESQPAFLADLATVRELPEWVDEWETYSAEARTQLIGGLRVFLETCPGCGGPVTFDTKIRTSCCRSHEVVTASCDDCDGRLFETPYEEPDESAAASD